MKKGFLVFNLFLLSGLLSLLSCSHSSKIARPKVEVSDYRVSVSVDGKKVDDFSETLVHHVAFSPRQLQLLKEEWKEKERRSLQFKIDVDSNGVFCGLLVTAVRANPNLPDLGLEVGDRITAIGRVRGAVEDSFSVLFDEISLSGEGSITIERRYRAQKIVYLLNPQ